MLIFEQTMQFYNGLYSVRTFVPEETLLHVLSVLLSSHYLDWLWLLNFCWKVKMCRKKSNKLLLWVTYVLF